MPSLAPAKASKAQATPLPQAAAVALEASEADKARLHQLALGTKDAIVSTWKS